MFFRRSIVAGCAAVIAATVIFSTTASLASEKTINLAATEYPPYYGKDLENHGFMTELVVEAFARVDYDVTVKFLPWKRALESTKTGKHDGLFTVWYREEREEWFVFSDPLPANELGFYKRKDRDISYQNYDDLKPFSIGVVRGYASPPGFDDAGLKTSLANDDEQNLRKLQKGRVDLVLIDKITGKFQIDSKLSSEQGELEWIEPPLHVDIQYLVISKKIADYEATLRDFNKGLAEIDADGT